MPLEPDINKTKLLDITSMGLSVLCLIHCLALPLIIVALPALSGLSDQDWVHKVLISIAVPLSAFTLYSSKGYRNHLVLSIAVFGLFMLGLAAFYGPVQKIEVLISVIGALSVAGAHGLNYYNHARAHKTLIAHECHIHKT